jgi:uncharacterized protein YrzB (UPF0473 family)
MGNVMTVKDHEGKDIRIEILTTFSIEDLKKNYVIYTLDDDGVSEDVTLLINEYVVENDQPKIVPIPKEETNMVLAVYNTLRENI